MLDLLNPPVTPLPQRAQAEAWPYDATVTVQRANSDNGEFEALPGLVNLDGHAVRKEALREVPLWASDVSYTDAVILDGEFTVPGGAVLRVVHKHTHTVTLYDVNTVGFDNYRTWAFCQRRL